MSRCLNLTGSIMDSRRGGAGKILLIVVLAVLTGAAVFFVYRTFLITVKHVSYERTGEVFYNPMMGFAPNADYVEAVGKNTLVYVDVTWRELEPLEGEYDFSGIARDNFLEQWRAEGKHVVFRFMCDEPSNEPHMDIPDWLYEKTGDGTFYDMAYGKGYSPDYANETLIRYHRKAIEALGEAFGQDDFFCYIELGSIGHWGEWHVKYDEGIARIPTEAVLRQYITPYIDAFPQAKLLMRRPFAAVSEYGLGVYNDMTGDADATRSWLSWIADGTVYDEAQETLILPPCPNVWEKAPVGGEFTSGISMEEMLVSEQEHTLSLLAESHMTFIGPKCPIANDEQIAFPRETDAVRRMLGYRYGIAQAQIRADRVADRLWVSMELCNYGVAPMYFDWPVCLYALDGNGFVYARFETDIKLSELAAGETAQTQVQMNAKSLREAEAGSGNGQTTAWEDGIPSLVVGIENPQTGEPAVYLDMDTAMQDMRYVLNP